MNMFDLFAALDQINPLYLLAVFAGCFVLLLGLIAFSGAWQEPPMKPAEAVTETLRVLRQSFIQGLQEGWRGYFAPFRCSPWRAAWQARCGANTTWFSPFRSFFDEIDHIVKGKRT